MPDPDYKEMYLKLLRATEGAMDILIAAQRECEEMYINTPEPELIRPVLTETGYLEKPSHLIHQADF